jgi:glutaconyl-CoA/methylmalonyl-CoA decarboxylase subunit gamma
MKKFEFTINGNKYEVNLKDVEENIAHIEVNGTDYSVEIHREIKMNKTPRLVRSEVRTRPNEGHIVKKGSAGGYQVMAPLPGSIFKMLVKEGDEVKKGDVLLIMEAMKMENNVMSEKEGVVKSVRVKVGDNVLQNDVLIELM